MSFLMSFREQEAETLRTFVSAQVGKMLTATYDAAQSPFRLPQLRQGRERRLHRDRRREVRSAANRRQGPLNRRTAWPT
jgi:hypothetical protein